MKTLAIVLAAALAVVVPASAYAATAAPAANVACDLVKDTVACAKWWVRCVGDALAGNPCHRVAATAAAGPDAGKVVGCVKRAAGDVLEGVTPMPCTVNAAGPDVGHVVACAKVAVKNTLEGVTPEPCTV